jgi:hypothetical protein
VTNNNAAGLVNCPQIPAQLVRMDGLPANPVPDGDSVEEMPLGGFATACDMHLMEQQPLCSRIHASTGHFYF